MNRSAHGAESRGVCVGKMMCMWWGLVTATAKCAMHTGTHSAARCRGTRPRHKARRKRPRLWLAVQRTIEHPDVAQPGLRGVEQAAPRGQPDSMPFADGGVFGIDGGIVTRVD